MARSCFTATSTTASPGAAEARTYTRPFAPCRTARSPGPMAVRIRCLAKRSTSSGSCRSAAEEASKPIAVRSFTFEALVVPIDPVDYYGRPGGCPRSNQPRRRRVDKAEIGRRRRRMDDRRTRSEEHTSELQSRLHLVCRLLLEKKKYNKKHDRSCYSEARDRVGSI